VILLNFAHPLTAEHLVQIKALVGQTPDRVYDVPFQIDHAGSLAEQVVALADAVGLSPNEWQTLPLLVNPPGYAPAAVALLAELHGRMGHFPSVLWVQPVENSTPSRFYVAEVLNLQAIRDAARKSR
jgi:hypothetical protein